MNTRQLENFIKSSPCLKTVVKGVFALNTLPHRVTQYPSAFIVNTDPIPLPGEHWVLIIIYSPWKAEFFDSLGRPPIHYGFDRFISKNSSQVYFMERQIQSKDSMYCGLYVLFFAIMRLCNHFSIDDVYSYFINNVTCNDYFVYTFMSQYLN